MNNINELLGTMKLPPVVSAEAWEAARLELLVKEKEVTRARDALAAARRRMPWLAVEKNYAFDGPDGKVTLLDLFQGRPQLILYRAFFEPGVFGWPDHACRGCSLGADQVSHLAHLNARDTTLAFASRGSQPDIARLKARMQWNIPWYTIPEDSTFDKDFGVDLWHGHNIFFRVGDRIFRTYFINNRGDEAMGGLWSYLDLTPLGRQETWEDSPEGYPQSAPYKWWNWHDQYDASPSPDHNSVKLTNIASTVSNRLYRVSRNNSPLTPNLLHRKVIMILPLIHHARRYLHPRIAKYLFVSRLAQRSRHPPRQVIVPFPNLPRSREQKSPPRPQPPRDLLQHHPLRLFLQQKDQPDRHRAVKLPPQQPRPLRCRTLRLYLRKALAKPAQ